MEEAEVISDLGFLISDLALDGDDSCRENGRNSLHSRAKSDNQEALTIPDSTRSSSQ